MLYMLNDLKLRHKDAHGELWVVPAVQSTLLGFRQTGIVSKEAGGILIGYRRGPHIEVLEASSPKAADNRRRHSFERKDVGHQAYCDARWHASGGTITYLGEWHTHPAETPSPSPTDQHEWGKLRKYYAEPLVFIIVGIEHWYIELDGIIWIAESPHRRSHITQG